MSRGDGRLTLTGILTLAMAISTFIQFALGALGPVLIDELDLSRTRFGALSTAFFLSAAVLSPFVGGLVDAVGGRRGLTGLFLLSAAAFLGMASADGYWAVFAAAALGGVGMAASNPVTNRLLLRYLPPGRRGTAVGVKQSGVWLGGAAAGATLPWAATTVGWRLAIGGWAVVALAGAAIGLAVLPRGSPGPRAGGLRASPSRRLPSVIRWLVPYAFLMGAGGAAITTYIALFAHERIGLGVAQAGATLTVLGLAGVVGRILWARVTERASSPGLLLSAMALVAFVMQLVLLLSAFIGVFALWVAVAALGATAVAWNAVAMMVVIQVSDIQTAGWASGVVLTGFFFGLVAAPVSFGAAVDATGSYEVAWLGTAVLFGAAMIVMLLLHRSGYRVTGSASHDRVA